MINIARGAVVLAAMIAAGGAGAQSWPTKPIRAVIPWGAGGGTDIAARALTANLSEVLGQQIIVDNRGGAGGIIGTELVARAPGDGYTIMVNTLSGYVLNTSYYPKLPYNPDRDFAPVTLFARVPLVMFVHPSLPVKTVQDIVNLARSKPGQIQYGSFATGSPSHFAAEIINYMEGVKMVHIPYKGGAAAMTALLGGEVPLHFGGVAVGMPHVKAGKIRALAVTTATRTPHLPDLPTIAEALKLKDYDVSVTFGVMAPASTPKAIIEHLHSAIGKVVHSPAYKARLKVLAMDEVPLVTPQELDQWLKKETARWAAIVRNTGIHAE